MHASNNLSMVLIGTNLKGILEVIAYKARLPLQAKFAKVGTKEQFLELMVNILIKSRKLPLIPMFSILRKRPSCQTESKAFLKSIKHVLSFFTFLSVTYLFTIPLG